MSFLIWTIILLVAVAIVYMMIPKKGKGAKFGSKKEDNSSASGDNA